MAPRVILYHGIVKSQPRGQVTAAQFESQILFLKKFFHFISAADYFAEPRRGSMPSILLTFDDGYKNNLRIVAPILKKHGVPALFFVSLWHTDPHKYLWFDYVGGLKRFCHAGEIRFDDKILPMTGAARSESLALIRKTLIEAGGEPRRLQILMASARPLEDFASDEDLDEHCRGLSMDEIRELGQDPLFEIAAHTIDHPFLSRCSDADVEEQIAAPKNTLEALLDKPVRYFAYPSGDYDLRSVDCVRKHYSAGFSGYANLQDNPLYEVQRFGIYRPGILPLLVKTVAGPTLRRMGRSIG